ncbi:MAG: OmpA family protein [Spirochaetaceae bacterium]|nr:OmpA family protein [Spirochaetaceae bacterium]
MQRVRTRRTRAMLCACIALAMACSLQACQSLRDKLRNNQSSASTGQTTKTAGTALTAQLTLKPLRFSPDGDGIDDSLSIGIEVQPSTAIATWKLEIREAPAGNTGTQTESRLFRQWTGTGKPPASISWDGTSDRGELVESATDYLCIFTCTDTNNQAAKAEATIGVDILVIREPDRIVIKIPSIVFRADHADFMGLPEEIIERNRQVIARLIQILSRFPGYSIRIEGHANNLGKINGASEASIRQEEQQEVIPLSLARAEKIKSMLIEAGIEASRLSAVGLGSSRPVVDFKDAANRWKNRRVEFVLIRP